MPLILCTAREWAIRVPSVDKREGERERERDAEMTTRPNTDQTLHSYNVFPRPDPPRTPCLAGLLPPLLEATRARTTEREGEREAPREEGAGGRRRGKRRLRLIGRACSQKSARTNARISTVKYLICVLFRAHLVLFSQPFEKLDYGIST